MIPVGQIVFALISAFFGAAAMLASQFVERNFRGTEADTPMRPRLFDLLYGTAWGVLLPLFLHLGVQGPWMLLLAYFLSVWIAGFALMAAVGMAPPPWRWRTGDMLWHSAHHLVLAGTTVLIFYGVSIYLVSRLNG